MPHEYSADFGVFRLHQTLIDLKLDGPTTSRLIEYFWENADRWAAHSVSQLDFDATARTSIAAHVGKKLRRPAPRPIEPDTTRSEHQQWEPCAYWGGTRECPRCRRPVSAGAMAQAQQMWTQHRRFVLDRLDKEIPRYIGGRHAREYSRYSDVEQAVWTKVADKIEHFTPNPRLAAGGALAWLTTVAHSVVNDWFSTLFASKRDVRREMVLRPDSVWADATRPAGEGPDGDGADGDTEDAA